MFEHILTLIKGDFCIFPLMFCIYWFVFARINGRRGVFYAYQCLIAQVRETPSLLVPCDFPKVSLHINTPMHSANRVAVPVAPEMMHCCAGALWKAIEYSGAFSRCWRRAYYPFSHPFLRLPRSLSSVLVCMSVRDTRCPWMGIFSSLFSSQTDTGLRAR